MGLAFCALASSSALKLSRKVNNLSQWHFKLPTFSSFSANCQSLCKLLTKNEKEKAVKSTDLNLHLYKLHRLQIITILISKQKAPSNTFIMWNPNLRCLANDHVGVLICCIKFLCYVLYHNSRNCKGGRRLS